MKNFSFIKNRNIFFAIFAAVVIIGIISFFVNGFNMDIDFMGGTEISYDLGQSITPEEETSLTQDIKSLVGTDNFSSLRVSGNKDTITIRTLVLDNTYNTEIAEDTSSENSEENSGGVSELRSSITELIMSKYENATWLSTDTVSAEISSGLKQSAILATVVAVILMLIYIAFRFQVSSSFAAVVCLAHDLFVMLVAYSIFQIPVNSNIIAALLTILGYSINATIIIFDRIRENDKKFGNAKFAEKIDAGIKNTLTRSLNTTLTTLFTIGMIYILGVDSIRNFAFPIIVGIIAGLFSSVCLAGPLWYVFKNMKTKKR